MLVLMELESIKTEGIFNDFRNFVVLLRNNGAERLFSLVSLV